MTDQINLGLIWAATGGVTAVTAIKYEGGWVAEIPTYQNFNYMVQGLDQNMLHFAESNSFNWQTDITYAAGARVVSPLGKMFTAKAISINIDPDTDPGNGSWVHGWLVGSDFSSLLETDGLKVEMPIRVNSNYTGVDLAILNRNPMIELRTTGATDNWAIANATGELVALNLGQAGPDGKSLLKGQADTHRLFHEGHHPLVSEVTGAIADSPSDGSTYGRNNGNWVIVSSTTVSIAPPPPVLGAGQAWYNLDDGRYYIDINDGDSSQWVLASPPIIPIVAAANTTYNPADSDLTSINVKDALDEVDAKVVAVDAKVDAPVISASVKLSANQAVAGLTWTRVNFDSERWDVGGYYAGYKYSPLVAGKYMVTWSVHNISGNGGSEQFASKLRKNGVDYLWGSNYYGGPNDTTVGSTIVDMNGTTDYLGLYVYHGSGLSKNMSPLSEMTFLKVSN